MLNSSGLQDDIIVLIFLDGYIIYLYNVHDRRLVDSRI